MEYNLIDVLATDYDLIRKKFCGSKDKQVINSNSSSIEDIFHEKLINILENYEEYTGETYEEVLQFIFKTLRTKIKCQHKQPSIVAYSENYENLVIDEPSQDIEYYEKLQLLLINYRPNSN